MTRLTTKVLVVDDEPQIRKFLAVSLEAYEYLPFEAASAAEAIHMASLHRPDVMLLDLGLPDREGIEIIREVRTWSKMPIIVLSVRDNEPQKVEAFDAGANDYLTKPFGVAELMARIRASLRNRILDTQEKTVFTVGGLEVDLLKHLVSIRGKKVKLTPKEYKLLQVLIEHAGRVVTHTQLIAEVWGPNCDASDTQYLRIYIRQLRRKIELDPAKDCFIHTEPGVGYRLEYEG